MEIRVTRPFIVFFIPGDQYGGPDCFISCLHVLFTEINQIQSNKKIPVRTNTIHNRLTLHTVIYSTTYKLHHVFP